MRKTLRSSWRIRHRAAWALAFLTIVSLTARAQSSEHPPTLSSGGFQPMVLLGQGTRTHHLGREALYSIALYSGASVSQAQLSSPEVPKALRIAVLYTHDWRQPP